MPDHKKPDQLVVLRLVDGNWQAQIMDDKEVPDHEKEHFLSIMEEEDKDATWKLVSYHNPQPSLPENWLSIQDHAIAQVVPHGIRLNLCRRL